MNPEKQTLLKVAEIAGVELSEYWNFCDRHAHTFWNPLRSNDDAFCLMVKMGLNVNYNLNYGPLMQNVMVEDGNGRTAVVLLSAHDGDKYRATRHAIVEAVLTTLF